MKYCPWCGAAILGGAVSFCAECGKAIPVTSQPQTPEREEATDLPQDIPKQEQPEWAEELPKKAKKNARGKDDAPKRDKRRRMDPLSEDADSDPRDDGYDGYYDDVRPLDNGHERERMDPALVKKIAFLGGGMVLIIGMAIALMLLL